MGDAIWSAMRFATQKRILRGNDVRSLILACLTIAGTAPIALAQTPEPEHQLIEPTLPQVILDAPTIELTQFRRSICVNGLKGRNDRTVNPAGTTIPSLWWTRDLLVSKSQFNPKLIEGWLVCGAGVQDAMARVCAIGAKPGRVEMVVNTQLWTVLDYLSRYELIYRFGSATSECGYNIYIFNTDTQLIADFTCDFQALPPVGGRSTDRGCVLRPDLSGKGGLTRQIPDGFTATDYRVDFR
jgi:hypothetical protein